MSLTFNNRDVEVWKALIDALVDAGFTIVDATYQVPAVVPAKAQLSKSGSGVGDIIVNVRKMYLVAEIAKVGNFYLKL